MFRGNDANGNYVGDVIGLEDETIEIPGAAKVERLLVPFWENGQHAAIPSITKQKAFVEDQRKHFRDINNYPAVLSERLDQLRDQVTEQMAQDHSGWEAILKIPETAGIETKG